MKRIRISLLALTTMLAVHGSAQTLPATAVADALDDLKQATLEKIDAEVEINARAFADAKNIQSSLFWHDLFRPFLDIALEVFDALTAIQVKNPNNVRTWLATAVQGANTAKKAVSILGSFDRLKQDGATLALALDGPAYNSLVSAMLDRADATGFIFFDYAAYKQSVMNDIYGAIPANSPLRVSHKSINVDRSGGDIFNTVLAARSYIANQFATLSVQTRQTQLPQDRISEMVAFIQARRQDIVQSRIGPRAVTYHAFLTKDASIVQRQVAYSLGTITQLEQWRGTVLVLFDHTAGADSIGIACRLLEKAGDFVLDISLGAYTQTVNLTLSVEAVISGQASANQVLKEATSLGISVAKGDIGDLADAAQSSVSNSREQINMIPQQMMEALPGELSKVLILVDDTITYAQLRAAPPTVTPPTISPFGGSFHGPVTVTLGCSTPGAQVYYTDDASDPIMSSVAYTGPFTLTSTATVKARAFLIGYNPSPVTSANFTVVSTPGTVPIIVATSPSGLMVSVDGGTPTPAPVTANWTPGQLHSISTPSPQISADAHTRYTFAAWSDGQAQTHTLTAPGAGRAYTATFSAQWQLGLSVSPPGSGTVTATPTGPWYSPGQTVPLTAQAASGYAFSSWTGVDSQSGDAAQVMMNTYRSVTASFSTRQSGAGSIRVSIVPQAAADQGAQWKLTSDSQWHSSGEITTVPSLGDYVVQFRTIAGWNTPGNRTIALFPAQTDVWIDSDPYTQAPVDPLWEYFSGVAFGNNTFVVVPGAMLPNGVWSVITTADARNWSRQATFNDARPVAVTYADGLFVALGGTYACKIVTSSDGLNWTKRLVTNDGSSFSGAAYGNGKFIAVGGNGRIATSSDGVSWTVNTLGAWSESGGVAFGANRFVTVDSREGIPFVSADGINWTPGIAPGRGSGLYGVAFGHNVFVTVGWAGKVITSPDGTNWASCESSASDLLNGIVFANNQFVAVGDSGAVVTSSDGANWVRRSVGTQQTLRGVTYGNNTFMAAGWNGTILPLGTTFSPLIVQQPVTHVSHVGEDTVFTVTAYAPGILTYQWRHGGADIAGETNWTLTLKNIVRTQAGDYAVAVSTPSTLQISQNANLTVTPATPVITWPSPSEIIYGTPLSEAQLNATTSVSGSFAYSPSPGTVLAAGIAQTLSVTFTPTDTTNYVSTTATVSISVIKAPLTVTAYSEGRTYGAANPAFSGMITGLQNGDHIALSSGCTATPSSPVGLYAIVPTLSDPAGRLGNYSLTLLNGALIVSPALLTVTAGNNSRVYAGPNPQLTGAVDGVQNGDNITATFSCSATPSSPVGTYPIVASLNDASSKAGNYKVVFSNGTLSVTQAVATVTLNPAALLRTYDGSPKVVTADTIPSGLSYVVTYSAKLTPPKTAGSYAVRAMVTDPNYSGSVNGTLTVNQAALTASGLTAAGKVYDGTTAATITGTPLPTGLIGIDAVSVVGTATGSFASKGVGSGKPVTVSGLSLSGADAGNYSLSLPRLSANITPAGLTISGLAAASKVYDGTTAATITGTPVPAGLIGIDAVSVVGTATGSFASKGVGGSKPVTVEGLSLSGTDAGNYSLGVPTLSASITPAGVTVSGLTAASKVYDGTTAATISGTPVPTGVIGSDAVSVSDTTTGSFASKGVGSSKPVTVSGLSLSGADAGNYTLNPPTLSASITPAGVTVSGLTAANRVYDGTTAATITGTPVATGVIGSDAVSVSGTATGIFASKGVGSSKPVTVSGLSLSGTDAGNYSLHLPTLSANITPAGVTVSGLTAANKLYDGTTVARLDTDGAAPDNVLPVDAGRVTLVTSGATGAFADKNVGTAKPVKITGLTLSGSAAGNYILAQPTSSADITALGLTVSGITAANKPYDGTTTATINTACATLNGVLPADTDNVTLVTSGATGAFADRKVGTAKVVTITGLTLSGSEANNYRLIQPTTTADIDPPLGLTIHDPRLVGHEFRVSLDTVPGAIYVLEYKKSFTDTMWTAVQTSPGTGAALTFTDNTVTSSARFYRVRTE